MKIALSIILALFTLSNVSAQISKPGDVDANAKIIEADEFYSFNEGYAVIQKGNLNAVIDQKGEIFIPFGKYKFKDTGISLYSIEAERLNNGNYFRFPRKGFINGYAIVELGLSGMQTIYSYINTQGKLAFSQKFSSASLFENGKAAITLAGSTKRAFLFTNGSTVPENENTSYDLWQRANLFKYNCFTGKYGYADISGKLVLPCQFDQTGKFSEGIAKVMKVDKFGEKKWAFIDSKGKQITDYIFSTVPNDFHNGLATVMPKDKSEFDYAYIDRTGQVRIKCRLKYELKMDNHYYDWVNFKNGYAYWGGVANNSEEGWGKVFVDTLGRLYNLKTLKGSFSSRGKTINGLSNDSFQIEENDFFQDRMIKIRWNFGYGFADINGNIVVPPVFSEISHFDPVSKLAYAIYNIGPDNKIVGYINQKGVFVIVKGKGAKW